MDFSEDWKSAFPVGSVFSSPPFVSDPTLGPLVFNPDPKTLTHVFASPSLSPPFLNPPSHLSLPRFISTSTTPGCPVLPSTASFLSVSFLDSHHRHHQDNHSLLIRNNRLQLLKHPIGALVFFSTGSNHDEVGFVIASVKENNVEAIGASNSVITANKVLGQRIIRILASQLDDDFNSSDAVGYIIGFLLVCTLYSVHWFRVKLRSKTDKEPPKLDYLGFKQFKSGAVAGACWNPHLPEESVVLLEDGSVFVFDLRKFFASHCTGVRVKIPWDSVQQLGSSHTWLGCEFSWHPRLLIVASSDGAFLVDWGRNECEVTCLADAETLSVYSQSTNDQFLAFSKSAVSYFQFVLVSDKMLLLCDVRKPQSPLLQWVHGMENPTCVDVFRLSEMRSDSPNASYSWSSSSGAGIILGSFWNNEFSLFCYGPHLPSPELSFVTEFSEISQSMYAWELPSELLLAGNKCPCERCLVREEFWRKSLPGWTDWQQKRDIVLGFGLLSKYISIPVSTSSEFGGFALIRLMSSGKLEFQRFSASWSLVKELSFAHKDQLVASPSALLLYDMGGSDYKLPRRFRYIKLNYLRAYINGSLSRVLDAKVATSSNSSVENHAFSLELHEMLCKRLKVCGLDRFRASPALTVVFNDVNLPASTHEIALRKLWATLPIDLLQLAFARYSSVLDEGTDQKVSLEFPVVPNMLQLPPFLLRPPSNRSNKWSKKMRAGADDPVGPVLPLPVLSTLHELRNGCPSSQESGREFSPEMEMNNCCREVMQVAKELAVRDSTVGVDESDSASLADDVDDLTSGKAQSRSFLLHASSASCLALDLDERGAMAHTHLISRIRPNKLEPARHELFDDLCPIQLKFDKPMNSLSSKEIKVYKLLKRHFSNWQTKFKPYQDFQSQLMVNKHKP